VCAPVPGCVFEQVSAHVDRFTPDERFDRPALGAVHGERATLLVEGGASEAHLAAFAAQLEARGRPPVAAIALTHWHWDHSFGSAAVPAPVIAHTATAAALAVQAAYEWTDDALDERVRDGREIAFCAEKIRLELPDRSALRIVLPAETYSDRRSIDLGGVRADLVHVGGDHAADSCVVHVPGDDVLFLGDCLYECLHAPEAYLTVAGVRALAAALDAFPVAAAVEGHDDAVADAGGFRARLADLRRAADLVAAHGDRAAALAGADEDLAELVGLLLTGERRRRADPSRPRRSAGRRGRA
jgi:glyoxylase-like metal-dependent hydrolase (beta-lactamase superfamily II)